MKLRKIGIDRRMRARCIGVIGSDESPQKLVTDRGIEYLMVRCKRCGIEREFKPKTAIVGEQAFHLYMATVVGPCSCGERMCDVAARIAELS
jgi:hypothetical protein